MPGAKKLIGVCLSQAHTFLKTDFLVELDNQARKEGYSIVVFNSSMDYYWAQKGSNATGCVYSLIGSFFVQLCGMPQSGFAILGFSFYTALRTGRTPEVRRLPKEQNRWRNSKPS